jgi:membrane fusion protein (multidrug efflux system)
MNLNKIPAKIKLIAAIAVILILLSSALVINREKMSSKAVEEKSSAIPVKVTTMKSQMKSENISSLGTVLADNDVMVISETQGRVLKVLVKAGDQIEKGAVLANIDDELRLAAYLSAKGIYEKAKKDLERLSNLYKENYLSDSDMENAKLAAINAEAQFIVAQRQYNDTKIKAPIKGVVSEKYITPGMTISMGAPVANIIDIENLKIKISIGETDIFKIKAGDGANVTSDVYPGKNIPGRIESVGSKGDSTHSFPVEISLKNPVSGPLKAGMTVKVVFNFLSEKSISTIPRIAIIGSIKEPQVFVVESGIAKLKSIAAGDVYGNDIEVAGGLGPDDMIVISGQNNLSDNAQVSVLN